MVFCTQCGSNEAEGAKFCHKCGAGLIIETPLVTSKENATSETPVVNDTKNPTMMTEREQSQLSSVEATAYEKGIKHEGLVKKILDSKGYSTELRKRLRGKTGVLYEIDIYATKGNNQELIVECKNYKTPVPREKVEAFWSRLQDLGKDNGLFVVEPDFSRDAFQFGQEKGLQLWSKQYVMEKSYIIDTGRSGKAELNKIKYNLPLKYSYEKATSLTIENKGNITIENLKLTWKPYYVVQYRVKCTRKDKSRRDQTIEDSENITIDAVSTKVIQQSTLLKNTFKKIIGTQTDKESQQAKENDVFLDELQTKPEIGVFLEGSDKFEMIVCPPTENQETVKNRITKFLQNKIYTVNYTLKRDEDDLFPVQQVLEISPTSSEIKIDIKLIYLPVWEMEFQSNKHQYTRKVTGYSGTILYDTITYCNKHINLGILKKKNIAVCDICGEALCKEHIWKCKTCGTWRCVEHVKTCADCQGKYCPDHIHVNCSQCKEDICDSCATKCSICSQIYCKKHLTKCSKCGKIVCLNCSVKEGGILKIGQKTYCKDCKS